MRKFALLFIFLALFNSISLISFSQQTKQFNEQNAFEYLKKQCDFGPRNPSSSGHKICMNFLTNEMKKFTNDITVQRFTHYDSKDKKTIYLANIIGTFHSLKNTKKRRIICAHWDTRPRADRDKNEQNYNKPILGANDGASGVAVLLEISRIMNKIPPPTTIDVIFFDGEDFGEEGNIDEYFLGSRYFAKNLTYRNYECAILLDMIGDKDLRIQKEAFSYHHFPDLVNNIWNRAQKLGFTQFDNTINGEISDDHQILANSGISAIDIIDFDYKYWHTLEDTPDKCSPQSLKAVGNVILDYIYY